MTVLLVASQERVQDLFRSLEATGFLQVRIVSSITDAEEEIAGLQPELAFIQSRISGLSGDIVLRHIHNLLPQHTQIVLLSSDEQELQKARKQMSAALDLAKGDEELLSDVKAIVAHVGGSAAGAAPAPAAEMVEEPPPPEVASAPVAEQEQPEEPQPAEPTPEEPTPEEPTPEEPTPEEPQPEEPQPEEPTPEVPQPQEPQPEMPQPAEPTPEVPQPVEPAPEVPQPQEPIPEMPQPAEPTPEMPQPEVPQQRLSLSESDRSDRSDKSNQEAAPSFQQALDKRLQEQTPPPSVEQLLAAEKPRVNRRKGGKWLPAVILATVAASAVAFYAYLSPQPTAPPVEKTPPARPHQALPQPPLHPAPAPTPPPTAAAPKTAPKAPHALTALPAFITSAERDDAYSASHPGWERYASADAEYKVFREKTIIKAVQIKAAKDALPESIFSWAKAEFSAAGGYKLSSKETKGNYQIEKWKGAGGAGLTVYRKLPDLTMKALVLYYQ